MAQRLLLVIDMLNDFMDPKGVLYCGDEARTILPVIRSLVDRFVADNQPVVYLRDAHAQDDREFELFPPHAVKDSWGAQIIPELTPPEASLVVDKTRFSALFGNDLRALLDSFNPGEIWISGVCTSICVMDTAGDLRNHDFKVVIPVNAVADFDPEFHDFALKRMKRVYGARLVEAAG
jgi:nicotinamidase/pyrazinamidase